MRGTVSVGVSRQVFLKSILKFSNLKNGVDFYFAYMPERLVEGNALEELENIPCLIAGSSEKCLEVAYVYSKELFKNVLKLDSLEEGEIVKLTTNSYRALNFTFSNEISRIANLHGLSGSNLIEKLLRTQDNKVPYKAIRSSRGKMLRAEPVSSLYEQNKVHHVGIWKDLEEQMCIYTGNTISSPDRLDALVFAVTSLQSSGEAVFKIS